MNNYEDSHRKASDDYNNGTIDEKMCPVCGTILSGKVKFCTECGFNFSEKSKKAPSRSAGVAIAVAVIAALLTSLCCVYFLLRDLLEPTNEYSEPDIINSAVSEVLENTEAKTEPPRVDGRYNEGAYKIGEDIPKGTYILTVKNGNFDDTQREAYYAIYSDPECNDVISGKWFESSAIVELETDGYVKFSWCEAVALDDFDGENSPFEHSGMFRCGVDFEAGTYKLVPTTDQGYQMYYVHKDVDSIDYDVIYREGNHGFSEGTEVTVKEGEILELSNCVLEKS